MAMMMIYGSLGTTTGQCWPCRTCRPRFRSCNGMSYNDNIITLRYIECMIR